MLLCPYAAFMHCSNSIFSLHLVLLSNFNALFPLSIHNFFHAKYILHVNLPKKNSSITSNYCSFANCGFTGSIPSVLSHYNNILRTQSDLNLNNLHNCIPVLTDCLPLILHLLGLQVFMSDFSRSVGS